MIISPILPPATPPFPQDYERWNVYDMNDKQALFKLIQELSTENSPTHAEEARHQPNDLDDTSLLDLNEDDDDDFLADDDLDLDEFTNEFSASPTEETSTNRSKNHHFSLQNTSSPQHPFPLVNIPKIRVTVRKRPLNKKEVERGDTDVIECQAPAATLYVNEPKVKVDLTKYVERHTFRFNDVFDESMDNEALYCQAVQPLVATIFHKGKGTVFAYGQTGSGKTYTMQPLPLRAAADVFKVVSFPEFSSLALYVSCYEIYGGKVFDLLNGRAKLEVREDAKKRVQVVGLHQVEVGNMEVLVQLCEHAAQSRSTGSTGANDESSRSHSVMQFALKIVSSGKLTGKLSFIDLAGSERGADTHDNDKQTRLEGAEINKSLLALKECIRALDCDARHIPFRGSKLTSVLRDSFVGEGARTVMIANVSPNSSSCEHTLNTLRYADRVKEIRKPSAAGNGLSPAEQQGASTVSAATAELVYMLQQMSGFSSNHSGSMSAPSAPPAAAAAAAEVAAPSPIKKTSGATAGTVDATSSPPRATTIVVSSSSSSSARKSSRAQQQQNQQPISTPSPPLPAALPSTTTTSSSPPKHQAAATKVGSISDANESRAAAAAAAAAAASFSDTTTTNSALMAAEDDLVAAHRAHIEEMMRIVREEMNLLSELDDGKLSPEMYTEEVGGLLVSKQATTANIQQQLAGFRRLVRECRNNNNGGGGGGGYR